MTDKKQDDAAVDETASHSVAKEAEQSKTNPSGEKAVSETTDVIVEKQNSEEQNSTNADVGVDPQASSPDQTAEITASTTSEKSSGAEKTGGTRAKRRSSSRSTSDSVVVTRRFPWGFTFLFVLLCASVTVGAYVVWQGQQEIQAKQQQLDELQSRLQSIEQSSRQQVQQLQSQQQTSANQLQQNTGELRTVIDDLDKRLVAQNKRLRSMSTTSREDWLLAEAEYLLKLANQRVLIEKNAEGAAALLSEADAILRDLNDPDLFAIRRAVKKDLAQLRLTAKIDVEGIYLSLVALADEIEQLPLYPTRQQRIAEMRVDNDSRVRELTKLDNLPWYKRIASSVSGFFASLKDAVKVHDFAEKPKPLLPPEQGSYLQQNLRMMIERAQLALLREQQDIYEQSLQQAQSWIKEYYPSSSIVDAYTKQLQELATVDIVLSLPDISASLELLQGYIIDLHKVGDARVSADEKTRGSAQ